ncbi:hypothetical protein BHU72_07855 [Desulfuribacillus stibiiarsenatis]|uniref:2Fe-2S ferredoxin-type domain-containing protein n=1 Tax=Desulfuribacillus stibiiarsenatis TaxID=1390249 RepID=A0A1E5L470_9FIRM|nr:2Fe-2S iron-sulfur cluster-binding protein [Desulfuribacillus stibiiarsenatis]OEH84739.1 hypothetical protein BHU72_07855 [Desulfuribacillus stibiiarsenatis]
MIHFIIEGKEFEVADEVGKTLLEIAFSNGISIKHACLQGVCRKCRVLVEEGMMFLSDPSDQEQEEISDELEQGTRLACQSKIVGHGKIVVSQE